MTPWPDHKTTTREDAVSTAARTRGRVGPGRALAIWIGAGALGWGVIIAAIYALV